MGRSRALSIPKEFQVEFPHLRFLNKALHKFYKGKSFPPHIDAVQLLKNFLRSNVFTDKTNTGKMKHRAVIYATEAMKDLYERSSKHHRWDTAKPPDETGSFAIISSTHPLFWRRCVFLEETPFLQPGRFTGIFLGGCFRAQGLGQSGCRSFWRGSHFDRETWIAVHFQPERNSTSGVPPEIGAQDVNEWLHGPGLMPSNWGEVRVDDPRFPYDWDSYIKDKEKKIKPPKWIRDARAAGAGLFGFLAPDEEELDSGMHLEEEDDTDLDLKDDEGTIPEIPKIVSRGGNAIQDSSLPREQSIESMAAPWELPFLVQTRSMHRRELGLDEETNSNFQKRRYEEDINGGPWAVVYNDAVEQLKKIRTSCPETIDLVTARPGRIIKTDLRCLQNLSTLIEIRAVIFSRSLEQRERVIMELQQQSDADRTALNEAKQVLDDNELMIARLRGEMETRNMLEESERAQKRQRLSKTAGNTLDHVSAEEQGDSHQMEEGEDADTNKPNMSDIDILRATYARHYEITENMGTWKYYKRAIAKFMPYWCGFGKEIWQGGFSHFKAELARVVDFKLPKGDALQEIYDVEFEAREEMECWDPLYDKALPVFKPEDVFGEE